MTLLESIKALPVERIQSDEEIKQVFDYLKNIFEGKESTPKNKNKGVDSHN